MGQIRVNRRAGTVLQILFGALVLSAAALVYGRTFIYHDSGTYYLYGEHIASEISAALDANRARVIPLGAVEQDYVGARSPAYSLLFYFISSKLTLWGMVAMQALACSWLLFALSRLVPSPFRIPSYWIIVPALTVASSLSYFVSYAMPDVFAGIGALSLVLLLTPEGPSRLTRIGAWALLVVSASFHPTHVVVLAAAAATGLFAVVATRTLPRPAKWALGAALVGALFLGAAAGPIYRAAERNIIGHPIEAPPFLTARVLADGTGIAYLREACTEPGRFVLCDGRVPAKVEASSFLWAPAERGGGYTAADPATRARLRAEQSVFVLGTIRSRPTEQFAASLRNAAVQLVQADVFEPIMDPRTQASFDLFQIKGSLPGSFYAFPAEPFLKALRHLLILAGVVGLALAAFALRTNAIDPQRRSMVAIVIAVVFTAVLVNAAVCGALSEPWPRYQARIVWIVPAAFLLLSLGTVPYLGRRLRGRLSDAHLGFSRFGGARLDGRS